AGRPGAVSFARPTAPAVQPTGRDVSSAGRRCPRPPTYPRDRPTEMSASRGPRDPLFPPGTAARWRPAARPPAADPEALRAALADVRRPVIVVRGETGPAVADGGSVTWDGPDGYPVLAMLPPVHPSSLGDPGF